MGLYILFIVLTIFYIVDCVISHKLSELKKKEVEVLKKRLEFTERIYRELSNQRNVIYNELKKFNNSRSYMDDGK